MSFIFGYGLICLSSLIVNSVFEVDLLRQLKKEGYVYKKETADNHPVFDTLSFLFLTSFVPIINLIAPIKRLSNWNEEMEVRLSLIEKENLIGRKNKILDSEEFNQTLGEVLEEEIILSGFLENDIHKEAIEKLKDSSSWPIDEVKNFFDATSKRLRCLNGETKYMLKTITSTSGSIVNNSKLKESIIEVYKNAHQMLQKEAAFLSLTYIYMKMVRKNPSKEKMMLIHQLTYLNGEYLSSCFDYFFDSIKTISDSYQAMGEDFIATPLCSKEIDGLEERIKKLSLFLPEKEI